MNVFLLIFINFFSSYLKLAKMEFLILKYLEYSINFNRVINSLYWKFLLLLFCLIVNFSIIYLLIKYFYFFYYEFIFYSCFHFLMVNFIFLIIILFFIINLILFAVFNLMFLIIINILLNLNIQ